MAKRSKGARESTGKRPVSRAGNLWQVVFASREADRWQLQDAKSQFSEVVQRALAGRPQCVTRHGEDAVVVIAYEALVEAVSPKQNLFDFFRSSPLVGADLRFERLQGTVREVEL